MASELQVGKVVVGDSSTNELLVGFESSTQDFSLGANGSNFFVCGNATDLDNDKLLQIASTGAVSIPSAAGTQVALTVKGGNNLVDNIAINLTNQAGDTGTNIRNNGQLFASTLATFSGGITVSGGITTLGGFTELTVASGGITVTSSIHSVDTEGDAASDNLNTINGGSTGSILILSSADSSRDVTLKDDSDNLKLNGDCVLGSWTSSITLVKNGSVWRELSRSSN